MGSLLARKKDLNAESPNHRWHVSGNYFLVTLTAQEVRFFQATSDELQLLESFPLSNFKKPKESHFKKIHERLSQYLNNENVPLVIMGTESLKNAFIAGTSYPYIRRDGVDERFAKVSRSKMHNRASKISFNDCESHRVEAVSTFRKVKKLGKTLSSVREISVAAASGQIQQLFVEKGKQHMGFLDQDTGEVYETAGDGHEKHTDIVETIKKWVSDFRGEVLSMSRDQLPGDAFIYAVLRW